ncbi:MAG: flavin reductase family protein [Hyphomicrobiales bacterium]|nr:flavin reductase family protein [Hyphomicrobiales bacterium]
MADIRQPNTALHERLRSAFGSYVTGVTVVTARTDSGEPVGFTANSFTSVSLDPALLLVCVGKNLSSYQVFSTTGSFAVNILGSDQKLLANRFARFKGNRFEDVEWQYSELHCPLLAGSCAWFDCRVFKRVDAGDHDVLIGQIHNFSDHGENGLGYFRHEFFSTDRRILT